MNNTEVIILKDGSKILYNVLLNKLATDLFVTTSNETNTNSWSNYFDELEWKYDLKTGFITYDIAEDIVSRLNSLYGDMINETSIIIEDAHNQAENYFDISLYDSFCTGYIEEDACLNNIE